MKITYKILLFIFTPAFFPMAHGTGQTPQSDFESKVFLLLAQKGLIPQSMLNKLTPKQRALILSLKKN